MWARAPVPVLHTSAVADSQGNFIWAGQLAGSLCGATPSEGGLGAFVAKLRPNGSMAWITAFGGSDSSGVAALAVTPTDEILIGGSFSGTLDFGAGTLTSNGADDAFVAKLDADGGIVWVRSAGDAAGQQQVLSVSGDAQGTVAITGMFDGTINWGTGPLVSAGFRDAFVARLDAAGDAFWANHYGTADPDGGTSVLLDTEGHVVVAGHGGAGLDLGDAILDEGGNFLLELDGATGTHLWSKVMGQRSSALALGGGDSFFASGVVAGVEPHLSKYDRDGSVLFDKVFTHSNPVQNPNFAPPAVTMNRVVVGYGVHGGVDLGAGPIGSSDAMDIVVGVFDHDGNLVSSLALGGSYYTGATGVAISPGDDVLVTGHYEEAFDFGFTRVENGVEQSDSLLFQLKLQ